MIGIRVAPQQRLAISERLVSRPETAIVAMMTGDFDILTVVATTLRAALTEFVVSVLRKIPGVRSTTTAEVVRTLAARHYNSLLE